MLFTWDPDKCSENVRLRKVDFAVAARIFEGPVLISEDARQDYGEKRLRAIGEFEGQSYVVAYTLRGEICRIITAWKVGKAGEQRYRTLLARRPPQDG
jgi:uncharacterized DUF497 family protein